MTILSALGLTQRPRPTFDSNGDTIEFERWPKDAYGRYDYTTRDSASQFSFELLPVDSMVRIYILSQPSYGCRASDAHSTHRLTDERGRRYVCIDAHLQPTNVPDALSWLTYWSEQTARYIRTGRSFS